MIIILGITFPLFLVIVVSYAARLFCKSNINRPFNEYCYNFRVGRKKKKRGRKKMGNLGFSASTMTLICVWTRCTIHWLKEKRPHYYFSMQHKEGKDNHCDIYPVPLFIFNKYVICNVTTEKGLTFCLFVISFFFFFFSFLFFHFFINLRILSINPIML